MRINKAYWFIIVLSFSLLTGCSARQASDERMKVSANLVAEEILVAMNQDDYINYTRNFGPNLKASLPEVSFKAINAGIKAKIGDYISKELISLDSKDQERIAIYRGRFSLEPNDVIIRMVLQEENGKMCVSGFSLDSPNLRK